MKREEPPFRHRAVEARSGRSRIERSVDDELAFHMEERARELASAGMDADAARARAVAEFGDIEAARGELARIDELAARRSWWSEAVSDLWSDARRTARSLGRRPQYAGIAALTLALGLGANATMFALVDRLLLSPPGGIRDVREVVSLRFDEARPEGRAVLASARWTSYRAMSDDARGFDVAAQALLPMSLRAGGVHRTGRVLAVTASYFPLLGVRPAAGRLLGDGDAESRSVVLSHTLWSRDLAHEDILGRDILVANVPFRVVGIAPREFSGTGLEPVDAWIQLGPATPEMGASWQGSGGPRMLAIVGRPHPGVSREAMAAEATRSYRASLIGTRAPDSTARVQVSGLVPGRKPDGTMTADSRVAVWLHVVSLLVLVMSIANVANLLLSRAIERRRETAVAMALGVSRVRLVRSALLESLLLGAVAAVLGAVVMRWSGPFLWSLLLPPGAEVASTRWKDAALVAVLALASALAMAVAPAVLQLRTIAEDALRSGARGASRSATLTGDVLVVLQVACSIVLLVGSGLFVRSMMRISDLDLGFDIAPVVAVRIDQAGIRDTLAAEAYLREAEARVRALPGVRHAASGLTAPYGPSYTVPVFLPGSADLPGVSGTALGYPSFIAVSPGFFATMGLAVLRGRGIGGQDAAGAPPVMVVDESMARAFWPQGDAIGRCLRIVADSMPCRTVVGVVQDTKRSPIELRHQLRYYLPLPQAPARQTTHYLFARASLPPRAMMAGVRTAVLGTAGPAPLVEVFPMSQLLDPYTRPWRLGRAVFVAFGVLATVIATIGLYGVVSLAIVQRRRELGIRMALGASRSSVLRLVVRAATLRTAIGGAVGLALALVVGRGLGDLLFRTSSTDGAVLAAAVAVVAVATLVACLAPAWRAVRVDPSITLRAD